MPSKLKAPPAFIVAGGEDKTDQVFVKMVYFQKAFELFPLKA